MFKPLHRLVTVLLDPPAKTAGEDKKILVPDNYAEDLRIGTVRGVGPGDSAEEIPIPIKPGDRVLVSIPKEPSKTSRTMVPGTLPTVRDGDVVCSLCDYSQIFGKYEDEDDIETTAAKTACDISSYDGPVGFTHPV